jgi:tripartite-type tricarboxylate transporter receptor subunit TctC
MATRRGLLAASTLAIPGLARAQAPWPDRPIRLLVGFPAGGPTDFAARILQEPLQQLWGQPLVIENRPGASQVIATEAVAKSPADGYTLLLTASTHTTNAAVYPRLPYDTLRDLAPIVNIYASPQVLFTGGEQPWRTVQDLVAAAKRQPGMASSGSGNGTSGHFAMEQFARKAGIELTYIAYRGGPPALADVVAGRVPMTFSTLSGALPLARDGKLRALAIAGPQRVKVLPEVPTLGELGFDIPDNSAWYGLTAPAATPGPIVAKIEADVLAMLRRPEIIRRIEDQGGIVLAEDQAAFDARIRRELRDNAIVAREANIRAE